MVVGIESCRLCEAKIAAEGTAFGRKVQAHSPCFGREEFENGVYIRQASDSEVVRILDQSVPRCRRGGESDFGVVNVCDCRNPEKVTGQIDRLVDSFPPLGDHQTCEICQ